MRKPEIAPHVNAAGPARVPTGHTLHVGRTPQEDAYAIREASEETGAQG
jgi:hypothetical protein